MVKKYGNTTRLRRSTTAVVVRGGKLTAVTFEEFNPLFAPRVDALVQELQHFVDEGFLKLPDSIFVLNPRDVPLCMPCECAYGGVPCSGGVLVGNCVRVCWRERRRAA